MTPHALTADSFAQYSPSARVVAIRYLQPLRELPIPVLASFLDRIMSWDWRFPAEQNQLADQLHALEVLPADELHGLLQPFSDIFLPPEIKALDWLNAPALFLERLTPYLWSSTQIDAYRTAAKELIEQLSARHGASETTGQRLVIVACGEQLVAPDYPLFLKLRKHGLHAVEVDGTGADAWITELLERRNAQDAAPYSHWLLDGGAERSTHPPSEGFIRLSYGETEPVRVSVLKLMDHALASGSGPEKLRSRLAALTPSECHADTVTSDPRLQRFVVDLFANGSGTQIYSTSFVQWSAREILRRAQPKTLVMRVAPRVRQRSFNEFSALAKAADQFDGAGSLIDGDLTAYYTWLELQNLPGEHNALFLAWFAGHRQAFVAGPGVPKNVATNTRLTLKKILSFAQFSPSIV